MLTQPTIRQMKIEDYDQVYALWQSIRGFAMRSIDDSKEGVERFLLRNPGNSVVAELDGVIVGAILCGHDCRRASLYHVCVAESHRRQGIGKAMVTACMRQLHEEGVNKIQLVAFKDNSIGNCFWQGEGWVLREDLNTYDFVFNEENIIKFNA